jgi:UDP-glucose 4-epimerase
MRVLITGGAGFIGSHLAERCLARGDEVAVVDDLSTGALENLGAVRDHPRLQVHVARVTRAARLARLVDGCDVVVHLAAAVGVRLIVERPVRTLDTNLRGTETVLRLAARTRRRVVLASTSEVYGKRTDVPFREDDDLVVGPPTRSRWSYACSKAIGEFLALAYRRERGVPVTIARLFNTIGPRQRGRWGMVVPTLVRQALEGRPVTVFGDGTQTRCFAHVDDVVSALLALAEHPAAPGEVFNVGSDREISVRGLAERIRELTGSRSPIRLVPYEEAYGAGFEDMARRVPDLGKLRARVGWEPVHDLDAALRAVIRHQERRPARRAATTSS